MKNHEKLKLSRSSWKNDPRRESLHHQIIVSMLYQEQILIQDDVSYLQRAVNRQPSYRAGDCWVGVNSISANIAYIKLSASPDRFLLKNKTLIFKKGIKIFLPKKLEALLGTETWNAQPIFTGFSNRLKILKVWSAVYILMFGCLKSQTFLEIWPPEIFF